MEVTCNNCKTNIKIVQQKGFVEYKGELIEKNFFTCQECKEEYIISYIDEESKKLIAKRVELRGKARKESKLKIINKYKKEDKKILNSLEQKQKEIMDYFKIGTL